MTSIRKEVVENALEIAMQFSEQRASIGVKLGRAISSIGGHAELKEAFLELGTLMEDFMSLGCLEWDTDLDFYNVTSNVTNLFIRSLLETEKNKSFSLHPIVFSALFDDEDLTDETMAKAKTLASHAFVQLSEDTRACVAEDKISPVSVWARELLIAAQNSLSEDSVPKI